MGAAIGALVAQARRERGLTQTELAELIGARLWTVEEIERGSLEPGQLLEPLATATGLSIEELRAGSAEGTGEEPAVGHEAVLQAGDMLATKVVLGVLIALVTIRFFIEKIHVLPAAFVLVDIPLLGLVTLFALFRPRQRREEGVGLAVSAFLVVCILSSLANLERVAAPPALFFIYEHAAPIAFFAATYRLWTAGNALLASRTLMLLGLTQLATVALFDIPRFIASDANPDEISGTFGENPYQLVVFLLIFASFVTAVAMLEPRRRVGRLAPLVVTASLVVIVLAQFRAALATTVITILLVAALLARFRGRVVITAALAIAVLAVSAVYITSAFPRLRVVEAFEILRSDPWYLVTTRADASKGVQALYADEPGAILVGTGPGTFSSRAWATFAVSDSLSGSNTAGPIAQQLLGGVYSTDVSRRYVEPLLQTKTTILGSRALSQPLSSYLSLLAEVGLVGFTLVVGLWIFGFRSAVRAVAASARMRAPDDALPALCVATAIGFSVFLQMAIFENWFESTRLTIPLWMLLAICLRELDARRAS